jgi:tetratricopeptide (TPR) repeat protein
MKKDLVLIRIGVLIMALLILASCGSVTKQRLEAVQEGLASKDYDSAFDTCYLILSEDIKNEDAMILFPEAFQKVYDYHFETIKAMEKIEDWDGITVEYDRIIEINNKVAKVKNLINETYSSKKSKPSQLKDEAKRVLSISLTDVSQYRESAYKNAAEYHYLFAKRYSENEQYREAAEELEKSLSFVPNYKDARPLADKYKGLADQKDALKLYQKGKEFAEQESFREASSAFKRSLLFIPDYKDARLLADKYKGLADQKDAIELYQRGKEFAEQESFREASNAFSGALSFVPNYKDAGPLADKYKGLADQKDAQLHYDRGVILMGQNRFQEADAEFQKANDYVPQARKRFTKV